MKNFMLKLLAWLLLFKIKSVQKIVDFMLRISVRLTERNGEHIQMLEDLIAKAKENDIYE